MAPENKSEGIEGSIEPRTIILDPTDDNSESRRTDSPFLYDGIEWKGLVPGDLPGESMVDEYPAKNIISQEVTERVKSELGWDFDFNNSKNLIGANVRIRDIVKLGDGPVAVITCAFNARCGRVLDVTKRWTQVRTMIDINNSEAEAIAGMFNDKIRACIDRDAKQNALSQALTDNENRINALKLECLKADKLDDDSVRRETERLIKDFNMVWNGEYASSEKAQ